jgi:hypothetical protein
MLMGQGRFARPFCSQKFQTFHKATGGPLSAVLASKIGILLQHVNQLTGHDIHVPKDLYPRLFLTTAVAEFMGALLFISDQRFGCWVLVGAHLLTPTDRLQYLLTSVLLRRTHSLLYSFGTQSSTQY